MSSDHGFTGSQLTDNIEHSLFSETVEFNMTKIAARNTYGVHKKGGLWIPYQPKIILRLFIFG